MPLTMQEAEFQAVFRALDSLSTIRSQVAKPVSVAIKAQIDKQFQRGIDPYGNPWAPHAPATIKRWGRHKILDLTGRSRDSIDVKPKRGAGITITAESRGFKFSQTGTKHQPRRAILPRNRIPATWRRAIDMAIEATVKARTGRDL